MNKYSLGFAFNIAQDSLLLIKKNRPWQKEKLNCIGGKIKLKESPLDCQVRGFFEETKVYIPANLWSEFYILEDSNSIIYCHSTFSNLIYSAQCVTDESVVMNNITDINDLDILYNLKFLIPLALTSGVLSGTNVS